MRIPTIHLNGSDEEILLRELETAYRAVDMAIDALAGVTVHGRDYYPQGNEAYSEAREEMIQRHKKLSVVAADLLQMFQRIQGAMRMPVYRIYTESFPNLPDIVGRYFKGATIIQATGLWENTIESSVVIEIIADESDLQSVVHLAGDIKHINNQQSVLVTYNPINLVEV